MDRTPAWPFPNVSIMWYSWGDQIPGVWDHETQCIVNAIDTACHDDEIVVYPKRSRCGDNMLERAASWLRKHGYPKTRVCKSLYS